MQGMFYSENRPNYLNYGFVGFMIGHEFSHAFDAHVIVFCYVLAYFYVRMQRNINYFGKIYEKLIEIRDKI